MPLTFWGISENQQGNNTMSSSKIVLSDKQYLTDNPPTLQDGQINIVHANTGIGKTTWGASLPGKKIIILPSTAAIQQLAKDLPNIGQCWGQVKNWTLDDTLVITTPESLHRIVKAIAESHKDDYGDYLLIVDEWHNFALSANYREEGYTHLIDKLSLNWRAVVGLTGTPIQSRIPQFEQAHIIDVVSPIRPTPYQLVRYNPKKHGDMAQLSQLVKPGQTVGIFCNSKGRMLHKIKATLLATGHDEVSIFALNSSTKDEDIAGIIYDKERLPNATKVIVFTSVFSEAANLKTNIDSLIFLPAGNIHIPPQTYQQVVNRFRLSAPTMTYIFNNNELGPKQLVHYDEVLDYAESKAKAVLSEWSHTSEISRLMSMEFYEPSQSKFIKQGDMGQWGVNWLMVDNLAIATYANYCQQNPAQLVNDLAEFNWQHVGTVGDTETTPPPPLKSAIDEYLKAIKAGKDDIAKRIIDSLKDEKIDPAIAAQIAALSDEIQMIMPALPETMATQQAMTICLALKGNKTAIKKAVRQIKGISFRGKCLFTDCVLSRFPLGAVLTSEDIQNGVIECYCKNDDMKAFAAKQYPHLFSEKEVPVTKHKATQLLSIHYDMKRTQRRVDGKKENLYQLKTLINLDTFTVCSNR